MHVHLETLWAVAFRWVIPGAAVLGALVVFFLAWRTGGRPRPSCPACGYEIDLTVGATACAECGADLRRVGVTTPLARAMAGPGAITVGLVVLVAAGIVGTRAYPHVRDAMRARVTWPPDQRFTQVVTAMSPPREAFAPWMRTERGIDLIPEERHGVRFTITGTADSARRHLYEGKLTIEVCDSAGVPLGLGVEHTRMEIDLLTGAGVETRTEPDGSVWTSEFDEVTRTTFVYLYQGSNIGPWKLENQKLLSREIECLAFGVNRALEEVRNQPPPGRTITTFNGQMPAWTGWGLLRAVNAASWEQGLNERYGIHGSVFENAPGPPPAVPVDVFEPALFGLGPAHATDAVLIAGCVVASGGAFGVIAWRRRRAIATARAQELSRDASSAASA